jgi:hypothetical protein
MYRKKIEISDENGKVRITTKDLHLFDEMTADEAESVFGD